MNKNKITETLGQYSVQPIKLADIEHIRVWRNEQMSVLRQKTMITQEEQRNYFEKKVFPEYEKEQPFQIIYSFLMNDELIGYGGLVHISWHDLRVEMSFLVHPKRANNLDVYRNDFKNFISLTKKIVFENFAFNRIHVETYAFRDEHIKVLEESGFILEGRARQHVIEEGNFQDSLIHGFIRSEYEGI